MTNWTQAAITVATLAMTQGAMAAVSTDEAKQLGANLTLTGAEKTGNGTIPPYSGKAPKAPASYNKADPGQRPDPYGDKPLFSITAQNANKYADKLDGMLELFKKYPNFRMDIYPTHRDYVYPKYVQDNTLKNATSCKGVDDELKLEGCYGGVPFPIPKTGRQVMWNHLLQYSYHAATYKSQSWVTPANGLSVLQNADEVHLQADNYDPARTSPLPGDVVYWTVLQTNKAPARKVGSKLLIQDSLDTVGVGRRVYQYIPGQRRVKLAPNLAYDTPSPNSGGASTMDDAKGFAGGLDRYDFKLVGKKEKFIMYNSYMLADHKVCPDEKVVNHLNFPHPDCVRWELHRVWQVEATLKPEFRHVYSKRIFYWDEDTPGAGVAENYDATGKLYRIVTQYLLPFYDGEKGAGGNSESGFALDLQTGVWAAQGTMGFSGGGTWATAPGEPRMFTPDSMAGSGIR